MSLELINRSPFDRQLGGVRDYVSYSRLALWLTCPLAFRFKYIDGIDAPPSPGAFLGKMVHLGLEAFYRHRQLDVAWTAEDACKRIQNAWGLAVVGERMRFASAAEERALQQQARDLVATYVRQIKPDEPRPLAVEAAVRAPLIHPATGEDLRIPLVGVIDLVLPERSSGLIVDFKTTSRSSRPLEISHELQMASYAYLFRQAMLRPEAGLEIRQLVKTVVPLIKPYAFPSRTEAHFKRFFAVVRAYLDALDSGQFVYRPNWTCATCEFCDNHCRHWNG